MKSAQLSGFKFLSNVGLRLISTVVLTRILDPESYGVFAIVLVYVYLLEMFSDLGVRTLILTHDDEISDDFLHSCWTVSILRGVAILVFSVLIAATIAVAQTWNLFSDDSAYAATVLPWAIAAVGGFTFLNGFQSPMRFMAERAMSFVTVTWVDIVANLAALVATIALALYLRSVWALVLGSGVRILITIALSFWAFPGPKMQMAFSRSNFAIIIGRGKWIIGHSVLTALSNSADRLLLGFVMSSATFGFYFIARQITDLFWNFLIALNTQMELQVFSHILKSTALEFRRNYYRYRLFFDAVSGLLAGSGVVLAPLAVDIIFDDRYADIAFMVQVLILVLLPVGPALMRGALVAERRFRLVTILGVVTTGSLFIGLGIAVAIVGSETLALFVIALHRVPEACILLTIAWRRGWVSLLREPLVLVFFAVGAALGWGIQYAWNILV